MEPTPEQQAETDGATVVRAAPAQTGAETRRDRPAVRAVSFSLLVIAILTAAYAAAGPLAAGEIELGPRPYFLIDRMRDGTLKTKLMSCSDLPMERKLFSIGHRGGRCNFPNIRWSRTGRPPAWAPAFSNAT